MGRGYARGCASGSFVATAEIGTMKDAAQSATRIKRVSRGSGKGNFYGV